MTGKPNFRPSVWLGLIASLSMLSCSAATNSSEEAKPPESTTEVDETPVASASEAATESSEVTPAAGAKEEKDEGPKSCPEGMLLVEGDYCPEVEEGECLKEWYDENNKKRICEEFKSGPKCKSAKREHKRYCIDKYEYPNVAGERPEVMNNFYQAQVLCAAQGRRMCTESEWTFACEGPDMKPFPHGLVRDPEKCRGDRPWDSPNMKKVAKRDPAELERLWQGVPSGSQPDCVSDFGVADMPGNADEVASNEHMKGWEDKFDSVTTGGPWYKGVRNQCRPKIYTHDEGFYYYYLSFRCCAEPDNAESDPRTPRQIARGWDFSRITRLANMSVEKARERQAKQAASREEKKSGKAPAEGAPKAASETAPQGGSKTAPQSGPKSEPASKK